jgi:YidC/Oxa1 family membrane protein insertase
VQEDPLPEFRNPNASGGGSQDNRSFLIMMVVMIAVIFGLQYYRSQHNPPAAAPDHAVTAPAASAPAVSAPIAAAPQVAVSHPGSATTTPAIVAAALTSTVVENQLYKITFSNQGGQVTSWILKKFTDDAGRPLDLVHDGGAKLYGYPLSLYTYDDSLTRNLADALYVPSATGTLATPATLSFNYASGNIVVHKTFTFGADYLVHADTVVLRDGVPIRALLSWPAGLGDMESGAAFAGGVVDTSINGKDEHEAFKKVAGGATLSGQFDFAGISDQYFAAIFLPDTPSDASFVTLHHDIDVKEIVVPHPWYRFGSTTVLSRTDVTLPSATAVKGILKVPVLGAAVGDLSGHNLTRIFVGPKSLPVLKSISTAAGNNLGPVLDFGFWGPVGKVLFLGLHFVQEHMASNWGWAIVIFTIFINVLLLPLRVQGMRSMLKMQRIQPQIDAIKAKYKNPKPTDPKAGEMNAEIMATQKQHGVSMFGGCIPSLIQLPLLFAFFTMMTRVVELRHAHWGWLPDLSSADPYHILPILMVITSFLVQFYTPSPGVDPQQQKMMAFMMPAFSGYMTWNYASGLALYWNVGNLIMILQQQIMNRTSLGREMREMQAKRAKAKTLPGKSVARTIQGRR